eukprot:CAMPEP_0119319944 /NCGR_PEP_ID=MMETSP1333-20130426/50900_1 /TAXON_ID=418940 /ORGANISM="Scyphosphaera apsteinii, Strain RCC1455" /LENGTH=37 /DNA_ID= /DNA_START= /DNA_END= /DNA_ORIENTATION=
MSCDVNCGCGGETRRGCGGMIGMCDGNEGGVGDTPKM